jgi:hypothetical protein
MATSFSGGGSRRGPLTMGKQLVNITADKPQTPKYEKDQNIDHELEQTEYLYFNIYTNFVGVLYSTVTPV